MSNSFKDLCSFAHIEVRDQGDMTAPSKNAKFTSSLKFARWFSWKLKNICHNPLSESSAKIFH